MYLSTADAAERLGSGSGRVRDLIADGLLPAERVGGRWLVPSEAVEERLRSVHAPVRPMSPRVAWAAAAVTGGGPVGWLGPSELSRLRRRITATGPDAPVWLAWLRRRAESVERLRVADGDLAALLADERVTVGGVTGARSYGVPLGSGGGAEVYVETSADLKALRRAYGLLASDRPNLVVRVAGGPWPEATAVTRDGVRVVPAAVVAADLLETSDARSRRAGRDLLRRTLDAYAR